MTLSRIYLSNFWQRLSCHFRFGWNDSNAVEGEGHLEVNTLSAVGLGLLDSANCVFRSIKSYNIEKVVREVNVWETSLTKPCFVP